MNNKFDNVEGQLIEIPILYIESIPLFDFMNVKMEDRNLLTKISNFI